MKPHKAKQKTHPNWNTIHFFTKLIQNKQGYITVQTMHINNYRTENEAHSKMWYIKQYVKKYCEQWVTDEYSTPKTEYESYELN